MGNKYLVSVVIPTFNSGKFIGKAIESVIGQTIKARIQIIVVDDNSTDDTSQIIDGMKELARFSGDKIDIEYIINDTRLGVAGSRNKAVALAMGEYIAFLDADDWWDSDKLRQQVECMENNPDAPLCCSARELVDNDGVSTGRVIPVDDKITYKMLLKTNSISCASTLIRDKVIKAHPMHNDELHEDYICWLEILKKYDYVVGINEPLLKSRMSVGGKSRNKFKSMRMNYGVYRLIGMPPIKAFYYMCWYVVNGLKKYYG